MRHNRCFLLILWGSPREIWMILPTRVICGTQRARRSTIAPGAVRVQELLKLL
ncbi:hypothetical protein A2U01_0058852, partial [Trifolium medium]|nr:hypothetical protein [Trifolium medium]